jgi:nucleotide-binding universal stress UspA family protein
MPITSVVAGIDFSAASLDAARWVSMYFAPGAEITLVHVVDPAVLPKFARPLLPSHADIDAATRRHGEQRLRDAAAELSLRDARCEIRAGRAHEQIRMLVDEIGADLVVVGRHGDRSPSSRFLGTTAERIVRSSRVPVLVPTNPPAGPPRQILVPVDDAAITPSLLEWTRELAERFDANVTLLHVWSNAEYSHVASMSYAETKSEAAAHQAIDAEVEAAAEHWLTALANTGFSGARVSVSVRFGRAGAVTVDTAATLGADLILMGRRGSGMVGPALLGSTVRTVLHGAPCPVLVVTEPSEESSEQW